MTTYREITPEQPSVKRGFFEAAKNILGQFWPQGRQQ